MISIVIPTLNEEKNLRVLLNEIRDVMKKRRMSYELIIIDKYSNDRTVYVAKKFNAKILFDPIGKGSALRKGMITAKGDKIITMDADCSHIASEIMLLIEGLECGFDICMGSRFIQGGGTEDMPWYRIIGNKIFVFMVNLIWRMRYSDLCYGYRSFRKSCIKQLNLKSDGFGIEAEISIKAAKKRLRVLEVPSYEKIRHYGSGHLRTLKDGWVILRTIISEL